MVQICFLPDDITVACDPGEILYDVANRAGIFIPTGCLMGCCHACEVAIVGEEEPVCSCITAVPNRDLTVELYSDPTW